MSADDDQGLFERIYRVVQQVPPGMVASYGDVAAIMGEGCDARGVGYALNALPRERNDEVPWQRVINSQGGISTRGARQRQLLEAEGIVFDARDRVDMSRFRWTGPTAEWAREHGVNTLPSHDDGAKEPESQADQLRLF